MGDETKRIKNQIEENIRLNKFLSDAGYCSRREADRLIDAGKVMVNYKPALMGQKVSERDIVTVNGHKITREEEQIIIAFNKPVGVECTTDSKNPDNIVDYIGYEKRIYPIGRLDKNSQGLILLTNDGSIVNNILKASNCHEKEYIVTVDKPVTDSFLSAMSNGVKILDKVTRKCKVSKVSKHTFCIILTQGLNRQIRRVCEALGYNVQKLKRVRIMDVELGNLPIGQYRNLTDNEVKSLSNIKKYKCTESVVICGAYMKTLFSWCNEKTFKINITLFNRIPVCEDISDVFGDFKNTTFIAYNRKESFLEDIEDIKNQMIYAIENRYVNGIEIVKEISDENSNKAVFPVVFTSMLRSGSDTDNEIYYPENMKEVYALSQTPQVSLDHQVYNRNGKYVFVWDYVSQLYDEKEIMNCFDRYIEFIREIADNNKWN